MANNKKSTYKHGKANKAVKTQKDMLVLDFTKGYTPINTDPITRDEIQNMRDALQNETKTISFWSKLKQLFGKKVA